METNAARGIRLADDRLLVAFGTEEGRQLNKQLIGSSEISFTLEGDSAFAACVDNLRLFSAVLRNRRTEEVMYGWGRLFVCPRERRVQFSLNWYDGSYFERRRNAHLSKFHSDIFRRLQIDPRQLSVSHRFLPTRGSGGQT